MANSLYEQMGNHPMANNEIMQIVNQVKEFEKTFKGDAKSQVENMVASGIIPQNVFNELAQIANQIMPFMPK